MGSRDKDQSTPHQPLLSSLVVRPTDTGGGGVGASSDYEPGYRMRAGSVSPVRRRNAPHRFSPGFEHSDGAPRGRGFGNGRDPARYRDYSPTQARGKDGGRFAGRGGYERSAPGPGSLRGEAMRRNNPNVQPREGDWICSDPLCKNLNFARREYCNNCNRPRFGSSRSPRRGYLGPPFPPRQRIPPVPLDHSPGRIMPDTYRSPPRGWPRDVHLSRDFRPPVPLTTRHEGRFLDPLIRNDRRGFPEDGPRPERYRFDRPILPEMDHRDRSGRGDNYFNNDRRGYGRRPLSPFPAEGPPAVAPRAWTSLARERSRSPVRGAPPKEFQRDVYRKRDNRRGGGRDAF